MRLETLQTLTIAIVILIATTPSEGGSSANRFIDNANGTVTDTKTGLMWAKKDNGYPLSWDEAKGYCRNVALGGHKDWRLPTIAELETLYDNSHERTIEFEVYTGSGASETRPGAKTVRIKRVIFIHPIFELTGTSPWSSDAKNQWSSWTFSYYHGDRSVETSGRPGYLGVRVLPVRSMSGTQSGESEEKSKSSRKGNNEQ